MLIYFQFVLKQCTIELLEVFGWVFSWRVIKGVASALKTFVLDKIRVFSLTTCFTGRLISDSFFGLEMQSHSH